MSSKLMASLPLDETIANRHCYENRRQTHTVIAMKIDDMGQNVIPAKAGIQRGEGEGSAIFIPLMWPSQGHGDSGEEPAPYPDTGPESRGAGWWSTPSPSMGEG